MKKVLLITDVNFWHRAAGNQVRIWHLIAYLSAYVELTVVNTGPAANYDPQHVGQCLNAEFIILEPLKYLSSSGYGRRLKTAIKGRKFDTVIIEYIHNSYFLNYLIGRPRIILDAHDIISQRTLQFKRFNYQEKFYELSEEAESDLFSVYDFVMAICQPDHERISGIIGDDRTLLCPHSVQLSLPVIKQKAVQIGFVGSYYLPNRDAINHFIRYAWPELALLYDINLNIYGSVCQGLDTKGSERVFLKGYTPDTRSLYDESDIMINPVRFGAGLKIKNIEAISFGKPLITTTHGARGLEGLGGQAFLIADEVPQQIASVARLVESYDLRLQMSKSGIDFLREKFSADACFTGLVKAING